MSRSPDKAPISGYVPRELKKRVQQIARSERRSVSQILEFFLEQGVKHQDTLFLSEGVKHQAQPSQ
ncbi:MAG: ribbon-helix-helix protein, CopG family [Mucilaginibacter polytrichastri]|nr:ribbon-helix-helix protein, CopG family [Mucilaginibacter polytrichastri]